MTAKIKVIIWFDPKPSMKSSPKILLLSPKGTKEKKFMEILTMPVIVGNPTALKNIVSVSRRVENVEINANASAAKILRKNRSFRD